MMKKKEDAIALATNKAVFGINPTTVEFKPSNLNNTEAKTIKRIKEIVNECSKGNC